MTGIILVGDARSRLRELPDGYAQTCITSPPYFGLRDYGVDGQIGLEQTPEEFVGELVDVFREVRRVLRDDGTLWLNLGDSYASAQRSDGGKQNRLTGSGLKNKDLIGIPWRVAFALQAEGWYLRQDIIWHKPNPMPESVRDRCTKAHEYLFLLSKSEKYYFDSESIKEPLAVSNAQRTTSSYDTAQRYGAGNGGNTGLDAYAAKMRSGEITTKNKRSVWTVTTKPFKGAHFATFPPDLIEPCVLAGAPIGGMVLDPFGGAGTTALVADKFGRESTLIELNPEYAALASERTGAVVIPEGL